MATSTQTSLFTLLLTSSALGGCSIQLTDFQATESSTNTDGATSSDTQTSTSTSTSTSGSGSSDDAETSGTSDATETSGTSDSTETSGSSTSSTGGVCGDGEVDPGEPCDDGNDVDGDGCNTECVLSGALLWEQPLAVDLLELGPEGNIHAIGRSDDESGVELFVLSTDGDVLSQDSREGPPGLPGGTFASTLHDLRVDSSGQPAYSVTYGRFDESDQYVDAIHRLEVVGGWIEEDPGVAGFTFDLLADDSVFGISTALGESTLRRYTSGGSQDLELQAPSNGLAIRAMPDAGLLVGSGDVLRFDSEGQLQWEAEFGGRIEGVEVLAMGDMIAAGHIGEVFTRQIRLKRWSDDGTELLSATWPDEPGDLRVFAAAADASGHVAVALGWQLAKFGPDGSLQWIQDTTAYDVIFDGEGAIYTAHNEAITKFAP